MDIKSIAKEVFELVFPLLKLEAVRKIGTDFKDATDGTVHELWQKVKPLFIEETEDLKKDPEDADAQGAARARLRKAMEGDEGLREELIRLLEQVKGHKNRKQVSIKRSKNVVVDGTINVNGDLRIGDDWKH